MTSIVEKRIAVEPLALQLCVSNTPVREALIRLAAEHVVKEVPKAGFFTRALSDSEIAGLYEMQFVLLDWALGQAQNNASAPIERRPPPIPRDMDAGTRFAADRLIGLVDEVALHAAGCSGNEDLVGVIANLNDRTRVARREDHQAYGDIEPVVATMCSACCGGEPSGMRDALGLYYETISGRLPELLRILRTRALTPRP